MNYNCRTLLFGVLFILGARNLMADAVEVRLEAENVSAIPTKHSQHPTPNDELLALVSDLAQSVKRLSRRVDELEKHNIKLIGNIDKLLIASQDLLYNRFMEHYERNEADGADFYGNTDEIDNEIDASSANALSFLRLASEAGHAQGQLQLGILYDSGYPGLKQSNFMAVEWYLKAALQNVAEAQCYVAMAYHMGRGVNQSDTEAVKWYRIAAGNGDSIAENNLGWMLLTGGKSEKIVTEAEEIEAVEWFKKASEHGEPFGKANLGLCYTIGVGGLHVNRDLALQLYRAIDKKDIQRYGTVALSETPIWRSNMMQWFAVAADAGETLAKLILEIYNVTESAEMYITTVSTNTEQII